MVELAAQVVPCFTRATPTYRGRVLDALARDCPIKVSPVYQMDVDRLRHIVKLLGADLAVSSEGSTSSGVPCRKAVLAFFKAGFDRHTISLDGKLDGGVHRRDVLMEEGVQSAYIFCVDEGDAKLLRVLD